LKQKDKQDFEAAHWHRALRRELRKQVNMLTNNASAIPVG
jgi:hypothetical protein